MSHILRDGEKFSIDTNGNVTVRNRDDKEFVRDGAVARVPMIMMDSARMAPPQAAPAQSGFARLSDQPAAVIANDAAAKASHARMKARKADAWKNPAPALGDASRKTKIEIEIEPAEGTAKQDAAYEKMKARKASAWEKTN
jgi:hypothetical protein